MSDFINGRVIRATVFAIGSTLAAAVASDWNQWRGPNRDGIDPSSPPLIDRLPPDGLEPLWLSEKIPAGGNGGWGSPVVTDGKVYLFAHYQVPKAGVKLPPPKFPALKEDEQKRLEPAELQKYEQSRQEEEYARRTASHDVFDVVYCLDATNGQTLWKNEKPSIITDFFHSGTPAVIDHRLYVLGAGAVARCLDADDGHVIWETPLPAKVTREFFMSSFAIADGVAVVLAGRLFGLDTTDGRILWEGDPSKTQGTHSSAAVWQASGGDLFVVNVGGHDTICVRPRDGHELWRVDSQANLSTPVIAGNKLLTLGDSRKKGLRCFEMSADAAKLLWSYQGIADKGSSPLVIDGSVYAQGEQRLACVDLESGKAAWTAELELQNPQYTSLIAADDKIFYAFREVVCFKATPADYELLFHARLDRSGRMATEDSFRRLFAVDDSARGSENSTKVEQKLREQTTGQGPLECASPAISDGRFYVRLNRGLACYDLRTEGTQK
ncbi:MAG: PQQ-binding-like beta-propeller repeat protein [Planctomycetaceae bacterium]|nr:PQQ-binding-like beta-propeller repeat protein [Planctomycetaceae bacterium]